MKKIIFVFMAVLMIVACQNKQQYKIVGTAEGFAEGDSVELQILEGRKVSKVTKHAIINGKFEITGVSDSVQVALLGLPGTVCQVFLEPGVITAKLVAGQSAACIGTSNNNAYEALVESLKAIDEEYSAIVEKAESAKGDEADALKKEIAEVQDKYYQTIRNSVSENTNNEFGLHMLVNNYYSYEPEELAALLEAFMGNFPGNARLSSIKVKNDLAMETAVGKQYKDFEMSDMEGNARKLSEFVASNKVTLVDFWASWCGPCRKEMPSVKAAYNIYKDKGFGIVGVSLDDNKDAWMQAVVGMEIEWTQLSDLKGWNCAASNLYGVNSIPATILIAQDGTILAKNLRGKAIQEKLAEVLK